MGKRFLSIVAALIFLSLSALGGSANAQAPVKKIGMLIWADEKRYETARDGFIEELKREGFSPPQVEFVIRRAGGSRVSAEKIAGEFATQKLDLYFSAGTSGTSSMAKAIKDVPIVFSTVYDPVEAGLTEGWISSKNNLTGVSNNIPLDKVLELAARIIPVKSVAVMYTPNEKNSESQLKNLQKYQESLGISIIPVPIVNESEIGTVLPFVEGKTQVIYLTGSIVIGKVIPFIVDFAARKKILTVTHLADLVEKGVDAGVCADNKEQGTLAGKLAARILKGAKPEDIPIEKAAIFSILINKKSMQSAGIAVPREVLQKADLVIE